MGFNADLISLRQHTTQRHFAGHTWIGKGLIFHYTCNKTDRDELSLGFHDMSMYTYLYILLSAVSYKEHTIAELSNILNEYLSQDM